MAGFGFCADRGQSGANPLQLIAGLAVYKRLTWDAGEILRSSVFTLPGDNRTMLSAAVSTMATPRTQGVHIVRPMTLSFGNIMLIARQKPDATNVAGLRAWNSLGRFVKRGENGIFILAPMVGRRSTKDVATEEPSEDATTEGQRTLYGFRAVYVFDRSQTEGKDLPALTEVQGDVSGYRERGKFVEAHGITLNYSDRSDPPRVCPTAEKSRCLPGCNPPRSSPRWCMKSVTKCCTVATAALLPPNKCARPRPKPWPLWSAEYI